jgi:hypothetical protein
VRTKRVDGRVGAEGGRPPDRNVCGRIAAERGNANPRTMMDLVGGSGCREQINALGAGLLQFVGIP